MKRSLLPKEHGAYAELGIPVAAALASARPGIASVLYAIAAIAAFFSHEPLRIWLGHRGTKAARVDGHRAKRRALMLGAIAIASGAAALILAPASWVAVACTLPATAIAAALAVRNVDRSLFGELVAGVALSGASVPITVASGVSLGEALLIWAIWSLAFSLSTLGVRSITTKSLLERRLIPIGVIALIAVGTLAVSSGETIVLSASPMLFASLALVVLRPSAKHVRRVGWVLAASVIATAAGIVAHTHA